ncbi:unnamed protein product, partial [Laminaria digitata]
GFAAAAAASLRGFERCVERFEPCVGRFERRVERVERRLERFGRQFGVLSVALSFLNRKCCTLVEATLCCSLWLCSSSSSLVERFERCVERFELCVERFDRR